MAKQGGGRKEYGEEKVRRSKMRSWDEQNKIRDLTMSEEQFSDMKVVKEFRDIFNANNGGHPEVHMKIPLTVSPIEQPARRVPLARRYQVEEKIHNMGKLPIRTVTVAQQ
jgi:hypothetical protein